MLCKKYSYYVEVEKMLIEKKEVFVGMSNQVKAVEE